MSASDIPEIGYRNGRQMARKLVTYLDDPEAVRRAIRGEFQRVPAEQTVREMRAEYLASRRAEPVQSFKIGEGFYPADAERRAEERNLRFLQRLRAMHPERFAA